MEWTLYIALLVVGLAGVGLNFLSLPGNWLMLGMAVLVSALRGWEDPGLWALAVMLLVLLLGEVLEFLGSMWGAKFFGASRGATWMALVGCMAGALLGLLGAGVGSFLGAILGAFLGALIWELATREKKISASLWAAVGAASGRVAGLLAKTICGLAVWGALFYFAWPG